MTLFKFNNYAAYARHCMTGLTAWAASLCSGQFKQLLAGSLIAQHYFIFVKIRVSTSLPSPCLWVLIPSFLCTCCGDIRIQDRGFRIMMWHWFSMSLYTSLSPLFPLSLAPSLPTLWGYVFICRCCKAARSSCPPRHGRWKPFGPCEVSKFTASSLLLRWYSEFNFIRPALCRQC